MRVIPPIEIMESMVLANSAAEPSVGELAYAAPTVFKAGDRAAVGAPTSTVTITNASPGVISWTAHGLADGASVLFTTTGTLPTGLTASTRYYVVRSTDNTFSVSSTINGLPIATTSAGLGTHTATAQVHQLFESLIGTQSTVTLTIASPCVVTWVGHGLTAATPIKFTTTGALPTGLTAGTTYYVIATGLTADTFQVSATSGGSAVNTSGGQSGTHTATANPNVGNPPMRDDGTNWFKVGNSNKWGLFDNYSSLGTEVTSPLVITIAPGQPNDALALTGVLADTATLEMVVDGLTVYSDTQDLSTRDVIDHYTYAFNPFTFRSVVQWFDLYPYANPQITITLTRSEGPVKVGNLWMGAAIYLGQTLHNSEAGSLNFSEWTRDQYGKATFNAIGTVPTADIILNVSKDIATQFTRAIKLLDAQPAFWSGLDDSTSGYFEPLAFAAAYRGMSLNMDRPNDANGKIKLEGI